MSTTNTPWEQRMDELWTTIKEFEPQEFVSRVDALADEMPKGDAAALFERGAARDSTGHPAQAIILYRAALDAGLTGLRRRRANIQLASSLRVLGQAVEALALLEAELRAASDELDDAVHAFRALVLVDLGREREALAVSLTALSRHLPRYNRSLERYTSRLLK